MRDNLNSRVLGQEEAAENVTFSIINHAAGLSDPGKPVATLLFLGFTGVGKTEMAKALTDILYQNRDHLIRLDLACFAQDHSLTRLIGSPPGYVNHEEGGN